MTDYKQSQSVANSDKNPYFAADGNPYAEEEKEPVLPFSTEPMLETEIEDILNRPHWEVKSVTPLKRIFMIDIQTKGIFKVTLTANLHFVNASLNPGSAPNIKQYTFSNDLVNYVKEQEFLKNLEVQSMKVSAYYRRMK